MADDLRSKLILAALTTLKRGDPVITIAIGDRQITITWPQTAQPEGPKSPPEDPW